MKPRVLFVMGDWPNPSETFLMREMSALARQGLDFEILATGRNPRGRLADEFAELSERVWFLPHIISPASMVAKTVALLTRPRDYLTLAMQLFADNGIISGVPMRLPASVWATRRIARGGFTRVHAQFASLPGAVGRTIAKWLKMPFSFSCHARDLYVAAAGLERLVADADFVVTCTDYNREFLAETFPSSAGKFHRVYHGIELGKTVVPKERDDVPLILAVGRLVEKKGFAHLISACKILTRRN
ncbi:MAG: glycosyltransferase, partial [Candidatus Cloacimonetes bacterium]|nr:glycosyltransferase [Candidatus Cloacimonadota bacterium]